MSRRGRAHQRGHHALARRYFHYGHAGRRRPRAQAAGLDESRRHLRGRGRRSESCAIRSSIKRRQPPTRLKEQNLRWRMTQIRRLMGATRRPGELGVHSLDHFNMTVPDMNWRGTSTSFGLDVREDGRGLASTRRPGTSLGHPHRRCQQAAALSPSACLRRTGFAIACRSSKSNGSRHRPASKPTASGSGTRTACWWKFGSRKSLRPTRSHLSGLFRAAGRQQGASIDATRRIFARDGWRTL